MQDWRFDEITRSLGKATSRRQVLKGLLGGVAAAVVGGAAKKTSAAPFSFPWFGADPFGSSRATCSPAVCEKRAAADMQTCFKVCSQEACSPNWFGALFGGGVDSRTVCRGCRATCAINHSLAVQECRSRGCSGSEECCDGICVDRGFDANNCGTCGHACADGEICEDGECHCGDGNTDCGDQCVDTRSNHDNCGACGQMCTGCEVCVAGQCTSICGETAVCCNDQCVPLCPGGSAPNPQTCECDVCNGQIDGAACDANDSTMLCCQEQCVSNQCPQGKTFSLDTCNCECNESCQGGQLQDPETCACQDLCANVTCDECQECDPTSGVCIQTDDGAECGNGTCCAGVCTADGGSCCPDDAHRCYDQTGAVGPCCATGQGCVAKASDAATWDDYTCCPIITNSTSGDNGRPYPALPDGTCCAGANYWVVNCLEGGWTCCDRNNGGLCC